MSLINWGLSCQEEAKNILVMGEEIYGAIQSAVNKFPVGDISILADDERESAAKQAFFDAYESRIDAMGLLDKRPFLRLLLEFAWPIIWEQIKKKIGA